MTDLEHILPLWRVLESAGADYVLATVIAVEGSSYRKPGARMLLAEDGRRAGTVSGGCLEGEVARRAWWLTENGPVVQRYSTREEDGDLPYGSGCGGVLFILLERRATAAVLLRTLEAAFHARARLAIATIVEGPQIGRRGFAGVEYEKSDGIDGQLQSFAESALDQRISMEDTLDVHGTATRVWTDYRAARPGLWIFGAGDDARPLMNLARELGWFVAVADGRSHLATKSRFASADEVRVLPISDFPDAAPAHLDLRSGDAAILLTHSFEQDARILAALLSNQIPKHPAYIGVLGPQRRTRELLAETARLLHLSPTQERIEKWLAELHAPMGIDLGAETPATIALSIVAEIQKALTEASGQPLREVRAIRTVTSFE